MQRFTVVVILALSSMVASCGGNGGTAASSSSADEQAHDAGDTSATRAPAGITLGNVVPRSAIAICGGLFRCCGGQDQEAYFADYRGQDGQDGPLARFRDRLPPAVTLDEPGCVSVLSEMLEIIWLGQWARQARDGLVAFDAAAAQSCIDELDHAACGRPLVGALYDDRCLAKMRSSSGPDGQRRMFTRARENGAQCSPVTDGFGGIIYGSCNPSTSFCCVPDPQLDGRCSPFGKAGQQGTCQPTVADGAACSLVPLKACATGSSCDVSDRCVASSEAPLATGAACYAGTQLLGDCTGGYCDMFGDGACHALKADGDACSEPSQCASGSCHGGTCAPFDRCASPR